MVVQSGVIKALAEAENAQKKGAVIAAPLDDRRFGVSLTLTAMTPWF
jgi:hypothetical protein